MEDFKVNICGVPYLVCRRKDNFDAVDVHFGEIRYKESRICLCEGMSSEMENLALFHEIVHGLFFGIGYNDLCNDETLVQSLAQAMTGCFEVKKIGGCADMGEQQK